MRPAPGSSSVRIALILTLVGLGSAGGLRADSDLLQGDTVREEAISYLREGRGVEALSILDSLLVQDLSDLRAGYLAARAEEIAGRWGRARCRYLELEVLAPDSDVGRLSSVRRRDLEKSIADLQFANGSGWLLSPDGAASIAPGLLLLPLENLGGTDVGPYYGLAWSYLLFDALRGGGVCPVPIPSMVLALDEMVGGTPIRAPAAISRKPVNTIDGLRERLAILPSRSGTAYLNDPRGDWDEELRRAIELFQSEHEMVVTSQADLQTQRRVDQVMHGWLQTAPYPLPPNQLTQAIDLLGASGAVRGTYTLESGQVWIQIAVLDSRGQGLSAEPIVLHFPIEDTVENAYEAARQIATFSGASLSPALQSAKRISLPALEQSATTLLLLDRGLNRLAEQRWVNLPPEAFDWGLLTSTRAYTEASERDREDLEERIISRWSKRRQLDPNAGFDGLMQTLGSSAHVDRRPNDETLDRYDVLGTRGTIRIRGDRP